MMVPTKCMEIFIHLCILVNYPQEINNIKIEPQLPKYLPPPFSVLIKLVHNHISIDEIRQEVKVSEFLEAPKLLICSKCNSPGHMKKQCQSKYDRCRRCGGDRIIGDHVECSIKCHHCSGEHLSTDYKGPILADYRFEPVTELKRHPERLPEHVQHLYQRNVGIGMTVLMLLQIIKKMKKKVEQHIIQHLT
ncbi:unnamed protein product [Rotaria magnacalcarata]|uniref:CCHC-type domain-containing protein n=2 Tax=Rotaria magnacalcarata TaxID=392030 RepID=A0A8S3BQS9_9BILA|nr:unnamed protein product [Rotaria magnacalcarata]CAF4843996.1 unnamed protein product [Rotaria magnacalcarata]